VEALGGSLRVETTPGGGATFVLTLPTAAAPLPAGPGEPLATPRATREPAAS
jgi:hypothetical protein